MAAVSVKTDLRQGHKGTRAMRQADPPRRQSVLFLRAHLSEGPRVTVGQEHRIIAEAACPPRRPYERPFDPALEALHLAVGPGEAKCGDESRPPALGVGRAAGGEL